MSQETTKEFAVRLKMAVEAHPLAPETVFGRQSWLREKLEKETGIEVSANAIHKWMNGTSRPREDSIRALARILGVDYLWLSFGRTPSSEAPVDSKPVSSSNAGSLILAGLVQAAGGSAIFAGREEAASVYVNSPEGQVGIVVADCVERAGSLLAVIPEPVGKNRIVAVLPRSCEASSACVGLFDLTDVPRQNFGGYSVISLSMHKDGRLKAVGVSTLLDPAGSVAELV